MEDPRSGLGASSLLYWPLLRVLLAWLVLVFLSPTFVFSAEPRYSGDDVMLGCEWLVGWLIVASGQGLATDRQTGSGFLVSAGELNHMPLSSVRG